MGQHAGALDAENGMAVSKASAGAKPADDHADRAIGPARPGRAARTAVLLAVLAACSDKPAGPSPAAPSSASPSAAAPATNAPAASAAPPPRTLVPFHYATGTLLGYRDARSGLVVLPPRYQQARPFSAAGVAFVWEKEWQLIDTLGQILFKPLEVDNGPDDYAEGVARFRRGGKVGFFDAIGARHDWAERFRESRAAFCDGCREITDGEHKRIAGGRWGYLDHSGREAISSRFDAAGDFEGGVANVLLAGRRFFIRPDGSEARPADAGR